MKKRLLVISLALLASLAAGAEEDKKPVLPDVSGTWLVNANGEKFTLTLKQKDGLLEGRMVPLGKKAADGMPVKGSIDDQWLVRFRRHGANQNYMGYLFRECKRTDKRHIAGFFGTELECGDHRHAWYAEEKK